MTRFVTHGEDGRIENAAVGVEGVNAACKQACVKSDKVGAKAVVDTNVGKVGGHGVCHGKIDVFFGEVGPVASEGGVAIFTCRETNGNGSETGGLTCLDAADQSVLPDFLDEICETGIGSIFYAGIPRGETAAAEGSCNTVKERTKPPCEEGITGKVQGGDHTPIIHGAPSFSQRLLARR